MGCKENKQSIACVDSHAYNLGCLDCLSYTDQPNECRYTLENRGQRTEHIITSCGNMFPVLIKEIETFKTCPWCSKEIKRS